MPRQKKGRRAMLVEHMDRYSTEIVIDYLKRLKYRRLPKCSVCMEVVATETACDICRRIDSSTNCIFLWGPPCYPIKHAWVVDRKTVNIIICSAECDDNRPLWMFYN